MAVEWDSLIKLLMYYFCSTTTCTCSYLLCRYVALRSRRTKASGVQKMKMRVLVFQGALSTWRMENGWVRALSFVKSIIFENILSTKEIPPRQLYL
jgi:hypothetical protein